LKEVWPFKADDRNKQKKQVYHFVILTDAITYYNDCSKWPPPYLRLFLAFFKRNLVVLPSVGLATISDMHRSKEGIVC